MLTILVASECAVCVLLLTAVSVRCVQVDKHESARAAKKAELIDNLKRLYPGVVTIYSTHRLAHGASSHHRVTVWLVM